MYTLIHGKLLLKAVNGNANITNGVKGKQKQNSVSVPRARRLRPTRWLFYLDFVLFALTMSNIAAKIAGSIGILPRCVF